MTRQNYNNTPTKHLIRLAMRCGLDRNEAASMHRDNLIKYLVRQEGK